MHVKAANLGPDAFLPASWQLRKGSEDGAQHFVCGGLAFRSRDEVRLTRTEGRGPNSDESKQHPSLSMHGTLSNHNGGDLDHERCDSNGKNA